MNAVSVIILLLVLAAVVLALHFARKREDSCCGSPGCDGCTGGKDCPYCNKQ